MCVCVFHFPKWDMRKRDLFLHALCARASHLREYLSSCVLLFPAHTLCLYPHATSTPAITSSAQQCGTTTYTEEHLLDKRCAVSRVMRESDLLMTPRRSVVVNSDDNVNDGFMIRFSTHSLLKIAFHQPCKVHSLSPRATTERISGDVARNICTQYVAL